MRIRAHGQAIAMLWLIAGVMTLLYILFWPFSLRLDARLSPTFGRAEVTVATFFRLRLEGDFLQPPYLKLWRLDNRGRRRPRGKRGKQKRGFTPVIQNKRLTVTLHVGLEGDGASTVEALGMAAALLETFCRGVGADLKLSPTPCFDKNICVLGLSGIGRFVLAQNILEYRKGKHIHAKR